MCNLIIHIRISCKSHSELSIFSPWLACADSEKIVREGPTLTFFLVGEGRDPNITFSWSSSARQRNAIQMAFRLRADDGPNVHD